MSRAVVVDFKFRKVECQPFAGRHFLTEVNSGERWMHVENENNDPPVEIMVDTSGNEYHLLRVRKTSHDGSAASSSPEYFFYVNWSELDLAGAILEHPYRTKLEEIRADHLAHVSEWSRRYSAHQLKYSNLDAKYEVLKEQVEYATLWQRIKYLFTGNI